MEEISNAFNEYVNDRSDKFFPTTAGGVKFHPKDSTNVGPMFGFRHFEEAHIKPELILPLAKMLDPPIVLVEFLSGAQSGPMKGVTFQAITSLRMCTWVRDFIMERFVSILNKELSPSKKYLFVTADQVTQMSLQLSKRQAFAKVAACYDVVKGQISVP